MADILFIVLLIILGYIIGRIHAAFLVDRKIDKAIGDLLRESDARQTALDKISLEYRDEMAKLEKLIAKYQKALDSYNG
jgi:hypothetical protein